MVPGAAELPFTSNTVAPHPDQYPVRRDSVSRKTHDFRFLTVAAGVLRQVPSTVLTPPSSREPQKNHYDGQDTEVGLRYKDEGDLVEECIHVESARGSADSAELFGHGEKVRFLKTCRVREGDDVGIGFGW
jgi:hypothetical protein